MIETTSNLFPLLSDWQLEAWIGGKIENIRFYPESGMLEYRLTAAPKSRISYLVPDKRVREWKEICERHSEVVAAAVKQWQKQLPRQTTKP